MAPSKIELEGHYLYQMGSIPTAQSNPDSPSNADEMGLSIEAAKNAPRSKAGNRTRKGTTGVTLMGSLQQHQCFLIGTFGVLPLAYFYIPEIARAYLFPQSVRTHYFCSGPISVDLICQQPRDIFKI